MSKITLTELKLDDVSSFSHKENIEISFPKGLIDKISKNHDFFNSEVKKGNNIYGVTTGFGDSSSERIHLQDSKTLQEKLISYHGCGVGNKFSEEQSGAILLTRLNCLAKGYSGVSFELINHLSLMAEKRIFPVIPEMGSVGASGDLTPLSYIAAAMMGKRKCFYNSKIESTETLYKKLKITPYEFKEREALAIVNGTSVMTGISALSFVETRKIADISAKLTGLLVELVQGRTGAYLPELHKVKPHEGQLIAANAIFKMLNSPYERLEQGAPDSILYNKQKTIQDSYSLRCAPHIIGVLLDTLSHSSSQIELELNSSNDNPIFDHENHLILNGGHFYGGHIAQACDSLKTSLANVINLLDRQFALLMNDRVSEYLTKNLVLPSHSFLNHGFKAMQITMSALCAETLKKSNPMSIYSRPTESSNQDVVSMGTIAARDLHEIVGISKLAVSTFAMAITQGFYVAEEKGFSIPLTEESKIFLKQLKNQFSPLQEDRAMDIEIANMSETLFQ